MPTWLLARRTLRILAVNRAMVETYGWSRAELLTMSIAELHEPSSWARLRDELADDRLPATHERITQMRTRTGTRLDVELRRRAFRCGEVDAWLVVGIDITARTIAETARAEAEAAVQQLREDRAVDDRFRALLEAAPDAFVITDCDGRIQLVNAQTEHLFGYGRAELLGQPVEVLIPERARAPHAGLRAGYAAHPRIRAMGVERALVGRRKDGTEVPLEISLSPIQTPQGMLVTAAIRDITERRRTELQLKLANRELEAFGYSVAHDLRAPLRGMSGFAKLLLDGHADKLDADGRECVDEILGSAHQMSSLIDALLSLSRLSRAELKRQSIDLGATFRATVAKHAEREPARRFELVVAERLYAQMDPTLVAALFENLVDNAWKFTSKKPLARLELGCEVRDGERIVFIRDNGAGFDMAYADKLFAPFQRLHAASEFPGTGVGLATVQRIVHRHGGRVWAEGHVGQGATFYLALPLVVPTEIET